jgi:hypothetical protein
VVVVRCCSGVVEAYESVVQVVVVCTGVFMLVVLWRCADVVEVMAVVVTVTQ